MTALDACHAARHAWQATQPQHTLDLYPDALNARPGPETARGPHAPISPPGSSVEGATEDGRKGNCGPAAPSLTTKQGRKVMNEQLESTKVGVEVETPQPETPETQTTEVEVETPEGQPDVEVEVETPKEPGEAK